MTTVNQVATLISDIFERRRLHWVEISVERAWSRDMVPRLFELGTGSSPKHDRRAGPARPR